MLAVHHLIGTWRNDLHVGAGFLELIQVGGAAEHGLVQGRDEILVAGFYLTAPVRSPVRKNTCLVYVQALGSRHVRVCVNDHQLDSPWLGGRVISRVETKAEAGVSRLGSIPAQVYCRVSVKSPSTLP